jgi:hypothetical protein
MKTIKCRRSGRTSLGDDIAKFAVVTATVAILIPGAAHSAELTWEGDFETGDFSQYKDHLYGEGERSRKKIVTSPTRNGKYATQLEILDVESTSTNRAELVTLLGSGGKAKFAWDGPEYWVGFSFLFQEAPAISFTFYQIHAPNEPKGDPCDFAGNTFSLWGGGADSNNGYSKDIVVRVIEDGGRSEAKGAASNNTVVHRYPLPLNEWQDYVVNFRLSSQGEGFYRIWKNGKQIYSKSGLTNVNHIDSCGYSIPAEKRFHNGAHVGVYAPKDAGYRRIFYDEVRIAEGSDGYELVAPAGGLAPAPDEEPLDARPNPPVVVDN